jgi:D-glycero-D-manno-heptose 1,7-bisphosphate phosphatase
MIQLSKNGFQFIIITNQAGIARQMISAEAVEYIHKKMSDELRAIGIDVLRIYTCPDHWNANSLMRKPAPGMFFQAAKDFNIKLDNCLYVGDDERDCIAAANAGCGMVHITNDEIIPRLEEFPRSLFVSKSLEGAVTHIIDMYSAWNFRG